VLIKLLIHIVLMLLVLLTYFIYLFKLIKIILFFKLNLPLVEITISPVVQKYI